jgi:hypothetical protein
MEVIDYCTVFFLDILLHTLPPTDERSSPSSPLPSTVNRNEQFSPPKVPPPQKKPVVLKFLELSLSTMPRSLG